ncbi:MAG: hypothetical protein JHC39_12780 [Lentimicrobium sp.]|jgi:hypothetical protein|nr:hypothetical protein [Lentimicrobium sp.]
MSTTAMSGNDTIILNNRSYVDFGDGDVVELTFPSDIAQVKTGKNGNSIYGLNTTGLQCEVKIRLIRGSPDDIFTNNLLVQQNNNFAGFPLMIGQFIKKIGDGAGNITSDTYILSGGIFQKQVEAKSNVEGDAAQSISVYMLKFSNAPRTLT